MSNEKIRIKINDYVRVKAFLRIARTFASDIDVITDRICIDAKSILGLYSIDLSQDIYVRIITDNIDEYERFRREMEEFRQ